MIAAPLRLSPDTVMVPRDDDTAVHHRVLGGLFLADAAAVEFLNSFASPRAPGEAEAGIAEALCQRGLLMPVDADDDAAGARIRTRAADAPAGRAVSVVQMVLANHCNLRCTYCFEGTDSGTAPRRGGSFMKPDQAVAWLGNVVTLARAAGRPGLAVQFFGGEPMLSWTTMCRVLEHFGNGAAHDLALSYSVVTNATLITDEIAEVLAEHGVTVMVSVDSPDSGARRLANGGSSASLARRGIEILADNRVRTVFNTVFGAATYDEFGRDIVDFAVHNGVWEIGVLLDLDPAFYDHHAPQEVAERLLDVYRYGRTRGVAVAGYWHQVFENMVGLDRTGATGYRNCSATGCQFSIEPSGDIFACKAAARRLGHADSLGEVLASAVYQDYAHRAYASPPACVGCELEHFCGGLCLGSLERDGGGMWTVASAACEVYKLVVRALVAEASESRLPVLKMAVDQPTTR